MIKFFVGVLVGFLYIALLLGTFYKGVVDECESRGYNSALVGSIGVACVHTYGIDEFRMTIGSF